ncbi:amino acid/polyamine transporter I [Glomus cerebriforme]|uniref:Amino acid/polyamine transporter I n=1 Tax=Glomus cerebriforme TaxID=658196 RepID=A0A397T6Q6_9GLOM|nr:amino acid/polyamine transporter I [Glomus cerebriforme]
MSQIEQTDPRINEINDEIVQIPSPVLSLIDKSKDTRLLGIVYGVGMNINSIIGSGIVTSPGIIWKAVKYPRIVLLLWFVGGLVSMSGSLSYVELGVIHKVSGGETKYLQTAYPNPRNMMSYLFSLMFIFAIQPGILSAVLQSAAQYFWYTVNGANDTNQSTNGWHHSFSPFWFIKVIAVAFLFIITIYHMLSNRCANYINQTLAAIKLATYTIIALAGVIKLFTNWSKSQANWQHPIDGDADITSYSTSILLIMFSYNGWNSLNYSLDEFRKVEKKLVYSNSISVGITIFIYVLVNIAFISVVPGRHVTDQNDEIIAAEFFRQLFGENDTITRIFTALIVLSVVGTAAVEVWSGSRVIVAAAKSDFFPRYSYKLRVWNHYFDTPINALLAQFVWCTFIILIVGSSFTITTFKLFSTFAMYSYWIFYFATGIGLLLIRKRRNQYENEKQQPFKVPLFIAGIFILAGLFILTFSFVVNSHDCPSLDSQKCRIQHLSPIFISYGFLLIVLILYYWWKVRSFG